MTPMKQLQNTPIYLSERKKRTTTENADLRLNYCLKKTESKKESVNFLDDSESSSNSKLLKTPTMSMRNRRRSSFVKLTASQTEMLRHRRMTRAGLSDLAEEKPDDKPKVKLENTFKMDPDEGTKFATCKVKSEIYKTFENYLGDIKYDPERCSKLCLDLSVLVKNQVKSLGFPRYKIISNVIIGQCKDQGLETASRSVWDPKHDSFAYVVYKNTSLFAIGIVHGVYFE
ncbi:unnamed protein product [Mytilus edulis]|uniref:Uncharacterized protein n=1 Tax=Mytilus edulis TaxID=6550 RepID=A0A8S3QX52_MYTED|nr:unnamed protein product [Mytilus edulis]